MIKRCILAVMMLVGLDACAQQIQALGSFTTQDAANAEAINPSNAACYAGFGSLAEAQAAVTGGVGLLTAVATEEQLRQEMENPACAPITVSLLAKALKATPAGPFLP